MHCLLGPIAADLTAFHAEFELVMHCCKAFVRNTFERNMKAFEVGAHIGKVTNLRVYLPMQSMFPGDRQRKLFLLFRLPCCSQFWLRYIAESLAICSISKHSVVKAPLSTSAAQPYDLPTSPTTGVRPGLRGAY